MILILERLALIPAGLLLFLPVRNQLRCSRVRMLVIVGALLAVVIPASAYMELRILHKENTLFFPVFAVLFFAYHRCMKVHISKSLAVYTLVVSLFSMLSNIANGLTALRVLSAGEVSPALDLGIRLGICSLAGLLLAYPYEKYGSVLIDRTSRPKAWLTLTTFAGVVFAINMLLLPIEQNTYYNRSLLLYMLLALSTLVALWLLVQVVFFYAVSDLLDSADAMERARFLELQESQFAAQQRYIKATERVRHDFRHSINTLRELYDSGEYDELGRYLDRFKDAIPQKEVVSYTDNIAVNALLNYYNHLAARSSIDYSIQVSLPGALPVTDVDLCSMIGNIMDNAIVAAQKTEEKLIRASILVEDGSQLYIVVTNSFDGIVRQKDGMYLSTNRHGAAIGLSSVMSTAESYGGVAQFFHEGKRFFSNVAIPLN